MSKSQTNKVNEKSGKQLGVNVLFFSSRWVHVANSIRLRESPAGSSCGPKQKVKDTIDDVCGLRIKVR